MSRIALSAILIITASSALANRITPEKQLDFWVGDWTVTDITPGTKDMKAGLNKIERLYGGKVIHESFAKSGFEGQSWSVYNPKTKMWHQTWVDSQGAYIAMTGGMKGDKMVIQTIPRPATPKVANRMIFSDIKADSFIWRWEATKDGGKTWKLTWRLKYQRKEAPASLLQNVFKASAFQSRTSIW